MPERVFMKLGLYIMAPEPISTANFINPSHQSLCLYVYPRISLLGNGFVKHGNEYTSNNRRIFWMRRFLYGPCRIKGKLVINSSQNFLLYIKEGVRIVTTGL
jgi:hypothetical protein